MTTQYHNTCFQTLAQKLMSKVRMFAGLIDMDMRSAYLQQAKQMPFNYYGRTVERAQQLLKAGNIEGLQTFANDLELMHGQDMLAGVLNAPTMH